MSRKPIEFKDWDIKLRSMVSYFIRKTSPHLFEQYDDLYHTAIIKFLECRRDYDGKRPFGPFLHRCVGNALTDYVRAEAKYNSARKESKVRLMDYEDSTNLTLEYEASEMLCNVTRTYENKEEKVYKDDLLELMDKCEYITDREKEVMGVYLENEGDVWVTAQLCQISESNVYKKLKTIVNKLQTLMV